MDNNYAEDFINRYTNFYFSDKSVDFYGVGIPKDLNRTDSKLEEYITKKIEQGIYDEEAFAWKAGKAIWKEGKFDYKSQMYEKWVNGNGGAIQIEKNSPAFSKTGFKDYLKKHPVSVDDYDFKNSEDRKKLYLYIRNEYNLHNFGSVNIINMMFFLSKGAIPLYDYYAHVGIKALHMEKSPLEVFLSIAPGKDDHPKGNGKIYKDYNMAVNALEEYIWLLKHVFPDEIYKDGSTMYISRKLDQALWVYGHAYEKYTLETS